MLARRSIEPADVVVLVVDATAGVTDQDAAIAGEADKAGRGVIIVANKWDLMKEHGPDFVKVFDEELRRQLKFLDYAPDPPHVGVDGRARAEAARGDRPRHRVAAEAREDPRTESSSSRRLRPRIRRPAPAARTCACCTRRRPASRRRRSSSSPTCATNFHFSYERFLVNQLRERFGFEGTPIRFHVRANRRSRRPGWLRVSVCQPGLY